MSKVYTNPENYTAIAGAIREKNGTQTTYKPNQMAAAIRAIETEPTLESLTVTENGTYTAPSGVDGYSPVTVNVSGGGGGAIALAQSIAMRQSFGSEYTFTAPINSGLCIVFVLHRKAITISEGWTLLHTTAGDPEYAQYVSVFYRQFISASLSFTVSFVDGTTTGTWPVNIHVFTGSGTPTVYQSEQETTGQHISLTKQTVNPVIWIRHEVYWWSDSSYGWETTEGWFPTFVKTGYGRLCTVVDFTYGQTLDIYPSGTLSQWYGEHLGISIV